MAWFYLVFAGIFEIIFTTFLKLSANFTVAWATAGFVVSSLISFYLLSLSLSVIPLGTAYAVWTGIGAFGTALIGIGWFDDPVTFWRLFFLFILIGSIVGLKFVAA